MATPKLPIRLRQYAEDATLYPRELTELDGKLYLKNEDGSVSVLNKESANTTYRIIKNGSTITLEGSDGNNTTIEDSDTTYTLPPAGTDLGGVKSGGDVTIENGVITVNDDSHAHTIENIDGLQSALDGKAASSHGIHVTYSTDAPKANGTASAGSAATVSRSDHVHPLQTTVSGNAGTATKLATARSISISGAVTATAQKFDGSDDIDISVSSVDGTKITGIIPLASIPKGAQERFIPVTDDDARLALTEDIAQDGDVIKVESTGIMYYVVDSTKFGTEDAFSVFTAGAASSVAWTGITGKPTFATVATSGKYSDLSGTPDIPEAGTSVPLANGTASAGTAATWSRSDHVHPLQTTVSGNAGTATKFADAQSIKLTGDATGSASSQAGWSIAVTLANSGATAGSYGPSANASPAHGGTFTVPYVTVDAKGRVTSIANKTITLPANTTYSAAGTDLGLVKSGGDVTIEDGVITVNDDSHAHTIANVDGLQSALDDKAASSHGTHVTFSTTAPAAAGTAAVGTATTVSRSDHVHPAQTTVSGNAGTATKFASAQSVELTGDVTGSASSQAGWSVATTLANSGVTAGSYGPSANASPAHGGTFSVPYVTFDAKGRATAASTKTITLPSAPSTSVYSATVGTTWSGSGPYTQTITVTGITADDTPVVDLVPSTTYATAQTQLAEYCKIYRITTAANSITVYATAKTSTSLTLQLRPMM